MSTKRYIIFDARCSICTQIAEAIRESSDGKFGVISIYDNEAKTLLDRAHPEGWEHAPYFVTVEQDKVHACTGLAAAFQLVRLVGIRNTWRIWGLARAQGIVLPPGIKMPSASIPRRQFLKVVVAAIAAVAVGKVSVAYACIECDSCGMTCYGRDCRCSIPCCCNQYGWPDYAPCIRWDCYDNRTGGYCGSFCSNCCCCGSLCA